MVNRIKIWARRIPLPVVYGLIGVCAGLSYLPAREFMITQEAWLWVIRSTVTLNVILLLFVWGLFSERMTRGMPRRKSWAVWAGGLVALIVLLRFLGGMPTIFG